MDVVIVTGAAGGIGSVYVKALAEAGYGVVAADLQPPEQLVAQISAAGANALAIAVDVSDRASTEAMAAKAVKAFGRNRWPRQQCCLLQRHPQEGLH